MTNAKIWLFWKRNSQLNIISQNEQFVHTTLWGYGDVFLELTSVYAKCSYILYRSLQSDVTTLLASFVGPWMVGGYFNVVRYIDECFCSTLPSREFCDMITDCRLNDLTFLGSSYTWCRSSSSPSEKGWIGLRLT